MVSTRNRGGGKAHANAEQGGQNSSNAEYEESRAQRIKENAERMKSLGIFDLSKKLKAPPPKPTTSTRKTKPSVPSSVDPPRRSSRLKDVPRVSYTEKKLPKEEKMLKNVEIHIPRGEKPEIYTEEHEKLLGDCQEIWTLYVDGYDEDGQRIYDPIDGKSCHQCRQKTLGRHTECSKCKIVTGQFCGDCLYMRYGENVIEVNQKPEWICPVCRGICNCSRCRRVNGWEPTGAIYKKVASLGFKSVAHYLIQTFNERCEQATMESAPVGSPISADEVLLTDNGKGEPSDEASTPPSGGTKPEMKEDMQPDSDEEYRGEDDEENDDGA